MQFNPPAREHILAANARLNSGSCGHIVTDEEAIAFHQTWFKILSDGGPFAGWFNNAITRAAERISEPSENVAAENITMMMCAALYARQNPLWVDSVIDAVNSAPEIKPVLEHFIHHFHEDIYPVLGSISDDTAKSQDMGRVKTIIALERMMM